MAMESSSLASIKAPTCKYSITKLRWELSNRLSRKTKKPLTQEQLTRKQAQLDAFESQRIAAGGKPLRALNQHMAEAEKQSKRKASLLEEAAPVAAPEIPTAEQVEVEQRLKEAYAIYDKILTTKLKLDFAWAYGPREHRESVKLELDLAQKKETEALLVWREIRAECMEKVPRFAAEVRQAEAMQKARKAESDARLLAAQMREEKEKKRLAAEQKKKEALEKLTNICVGCRKGFPERLFLQHKWDCKPYQRLPDDRWGLKPGEEPSSPTLQAIKKKEIQEGIWCYYDKKRFPVVWI